MLIINGTSKPTKPSVITITTALKILEDGIVQAGVVQ